MPPTTHRPDSQMANLLPDRSSARASHWSFAEKILETEVVQQDAADSQVVAASRVEDAAAPLQAVKSSFDDAYHRLLPADHKIDSKATASEWAGPHNEAVLEVEATAKAGGPSAAVTLAK